MSNELRSYPKVYALGHAAIVDLLKDDVVVEEKIDGSQFSFGIRGGVLHCRSKGAIINVEAPEKMFEEAVKTALSRASLLKEGWTIRCEYLKKPKHNTLAYDRIPKAHLIVFDVDTGDQKYLDPTDRFITARDLRLECATTFYSGRIESLDQFKDLLNTQSVLGGQKVEGVVIKNYHRFGRDGKALMGKYVSEEFKEVHKKDWKERHPAGADIKQQIGEALRTPARWEKSIQHLRDAGQLQNSPVDIGPLIKEISQDVLEECREEIMEKLMKWAWKDISRMVTRGFPEWYKERLAKQQFGEAEDIVETLDGRDAT